jgi:hypothetical protein
LLETSETLPSAGVNAFPFAGITPDDIRIPKEANKAKEHAIIGFWINNSSVNDSSVNNSSG